MIPDIIPDAPSRSEGKAAIFRVCQVLPVKGEVYRVPDWGNYAEASGEYQVMEVNGHYLKLEEVNHRYIINAMWDTWYRLRAQRRATFLRA
jgi:hypothetical protein